MTSVFSGKRQSWLLDDTPADGADARFETQAADRRFEGNVVAPEALQLCFDLDQVGPPIEILAAHGSKDELVSPRMSPRWAWSRTAVSSAAVVSRAVFIDGTFPRHDERSG